MKKTAVLMVLTIISTIISFAREIILSYFYGASNVTDVYIISLTIPQTIFAFVGAGIATSFIPMYNKIEKEASTLEADKFTSIIINFLFILCTIIVISTFIFATPIVKLFASGFNADTLEIAVNFTKISIFGVYFTGMIFIYSSYLQLKDNFYATGLMSIPLNLFTILSIILSIMFNKLLILPIGSLLAIAIQLLFLTPFVYKKGYKHSYELDFRNYYFRKLLKNSLPVIFGVSIYQINTLVDRTFASQIETGGISVLSYANRISALIFAIVAVPIATVMYPTITRFASEKNVYKLKKTVSDAVTSINLLVLPITVGAMIFTKPIVSLLFGRGAFDSQAISMTSESLFFYSIGMIGFALREILYRTFYALQDTKTPMYNAAVALFINIVLIIILSKYMGIGGLALATSISALFCTALLFLNLRRKIGPLGIKDIVISFVKILFVSLVMGLITRYIYGILISILNTKISLILSIGIGAFIYFFMIYFVRIEGVDTIISALKQKVRKLVRR